MSDDENSDRDLLEMSIEMPLEGDPNEAMLTQKQRSYLRGFERGLGKSTDRSRREGIRNRIKNTWLDNAITFEHISLEDSSQLVLRRQGSTKQLQDYTDVDDVVGPPELRWSYVIPSDEPDSPIVGTGGLRQVFGLGCLSLYSALVDQNDWRDADYKELLEALVAGAIRDTLAKHGRVSTVDVEIDIADKQNDLTEDADSLEDWRVLYSHRAIEPEEFYRNED